MTYRQDAINDMLKSLDEDDYSMIIDLIKSLSSIRKREKSMKMLSAMDKFQNIIGDEKGWNNEEELLKDMAEFRKSRLCL